MFKSIRDWNTAPEQKMAAELFKAVFEQDVIGMALRSIDPHDPRWLDVNNTFCEILGYSRDELLQLTSVDISHPDEQDDIIYHNTRLLSGEIKSYSREKQFVHKQGHAIWANIWLSVVGGRWF